MRENFTVERYHGRQVNRYDAIGIILLGCGYGSLRPASGAAR
jgi:hypothetical protein